MSDLMFDEVPFYKKGYWKEIAIHDENNICGLFGKFRYLSNFEPCQCMYQGMIFTSSENAYQAAKLKNKEDREIYQTISAYDSKNHWKSFGIEKLTEDWDNKKYQVMLEVLTSKFLLNDYLREKLILTADKFIREDNWWGDVYWGYDVNQKQGENNLGKILMKIRDYWRK